MTKLNFGNTLLNPELRRQLVESGLVCSSGRKRLDTACVADDDDEVADPHKVPQAGK